MAERQTISLDDLFAGMPRAEFLQQHFLRFPFSRPGGCRGWIELGSWDAVSAVYGQVDADVLIVRDGCRWEGTSRPDWTTARQLFADGYTLLVRHAERHAEPLAQLAAEFRAAFCGPVDVHIYCTPGGRHGFGWHYDAEDVFILQTQGLKTYSLRKNTVNPWPLVETMPDDLRYQREIMPLVRCTLAAGDWLYIPHGYWHKADAQQDSISLAVGVMTLPALEVLEVARHALVDSLRWRQRLPVPDGDGSDEESLLAGYRALLAELADDLKQTLTKDAFARQLVAHLRERRGAEEPPP